MPVNWKYCSLKKRKHCQNHSRGETLAFKITQKKALSNIKLCSNSQEETLVINWKYLGRWIATWSICRTLPSIFSNQSSLEVQAEQEKLFQYLFSILKIILPDSSLRPPKCAFTRGRCCVMGLKLSGNWAIQKSRTGLLNDPNISFHSWKEVLLIYYYHHGFQEFIDRQRICLVLKAFHAVNASNSIFLPKIFISCVQPLCKPVFAPFREKFWLRLINYSLAFLEVEVDFDATHISD